MAYSGTPSPGEWGREATYQDLQNSKKMLEECCFVGLTENVSDFCYIFNELGVRRYLGGRNVSVNYYIPDEESRHLAAAHNALDCELYDYARELKIGP
jgi:hypothetical protein